jgi:hypothetical protein
MNPFTAKDGSRHTNRDTMKRADAMYASKQPAQPSAQGDGDAGMDDGGDPQDGKAMAEQHGPAIEVSVHHDHEGGSHKVHAVHPDGHEHDTEHGSADEAHQFASDCAGCGEGGDGGGMSGAMGGM